MEPISIIIKEIPEQGWLKDWGPLLTAIVAMLVSIYSAHLSRKEQIRASRPFVWAMNFASLGDNNQVKNHPDTIIYMISNAPAMIITSHIGLYGVDENSDKFILHEHQSKDTVKYPSDKSQSTYTIPEFQKQLERSQQYKKLIRVVKIRYRSLAGGRSYFYEFRSLYDPGENRWRETHEEGT